MKLPKKCNLFIILHSGITSGVLFWLRSLLFCLKNRKVCIVQLYDNLPLCWVNRQVCQSFYCYCVLLTFPKHNLSLMRANDIKEYKVWGKGQGHFKTIQHQEFHGRQQAGCVRSNIVFCGQNNSICLFFQIWKFSLFVHLITKSQTLNMD